MNSSFKNKNKKLKLQNLEKLNLPRIFKIQFSISPYNKIKINYFTFKLLRINNPNSTK